MVAMKGIASQAQGVSWLYEYLSAPGRFAGLMTTVPLRVIVGGGLVALVLLAIPAARSVWPGASARQASHMAIGTAPLSGNWGCLLNGVPMETLSINGWNYVLGSNSLGRAVGTLERVSYGTKYHEKVIRVPSGALKETFGVKLGFHYNVLGETEALVFNIGPASGIRCTRI